MTDERAREAEAAEVAERLTRSLTAITKPSVSASLVLRARLRAVVEELLMLRVPKADWPDHLNKSVDDWQAETGEKAWRVEDMGEHPKLKPAP